MGVGAEGDERGAGGMGRGEGKGRGREGIRWRRERGRGELAFGFFEHALHGARAAAAGHFDVEVVVVGHFYFVAFINPY